MDTLEKRIKYLEDKVNYLENRLKKLEKDEGKTIPSENMRKHGYNPIPYIPEKIGG